MNKFGRLYESFCWYVNYTTGLLQCVLWTTVAYELWDNFSLLDAYIHNYLLLENIKAAIILSRFKGA